MLKESSNQNVHLKYWDLLNFKFSATSLVFYFAKHVSLVPNGNLTKTTELRPLTKKISKKNREGIQSVTFPLIYID